jgi:hypothetical protein
MSDVQEHLRLTDSDVISILAKNIQDVDLEIAVDTYYIGLAVRNYLLQEFEKKNSKNRLYSMLKNEDIFKLLFLTLVPVFKLMLINISKLAAKIARR